jgi:O-antigen/teichoic acid export membrane protein
VNSDVARPADPDERTLAVETDGRIDPTAPPGAEMVSVATELEAASEGSGIVSGLRHAGPIALAGVAANVANVAVTVGVARLLTSRGYGELAQLNGLFLVFSMPGSALLVGVVRRVTALSETGVGGEIKRFIRWLHRCSIAGVVALVLCAWLVQHVVAHALSLNDPLGVVAIVSAGGFWLALSIDRGLIQSRRAYGAMAANLIVEGGVRTVFVLILTAAGFGVTGACVGVLIGEATAAAHARFEATRKWAHVTTLDLPSDPSAASATAHGRGRLAIDVAIAFVCLGFLAFLQNIDVLLLGREAPKNSGEYAAISVAAKALVFIAIALAAYLLPEATIRWHKGEHALRQLGTTALIVAVPAVGLLCVSLLASRLLLRIAFGARLVGASGSLKTLVLAMIFLCVTVLLTNYLLGAGKRWIAAVLAAGTAALAFAVYVAHGNPVKTARADLLVQVAIVVAVGIGFIASHRDPTRRAGIGR